MRTLSSLAGPSSPPLFNMLEFGLAPTRFATRHARTFGRSYSVPALGASFLFTADPAHVKRIFSADSSTFLSFSAFSLRNIFGPRSVLLTSGPTHARQRKLLAPPLTGPRLRAFGTTMQQIANEHVSALRAGQTFRAVDLTTDFTLDVIVRTVFGVENPAAAHELKQLLGEIVHSVPPIAIFVPRLQQRWFPPWARYQRLRARFNQWVHAQIAQRRREPLRRDDVLSLLLEARYDDGSEIGSDEICDQLVTLLLAGHETTALALATSLGRLHQHPESLAKLKAELGAQTTPEEAQRLPYLAAVIDETLRIDPIVTDVARVPTGLFHVEDDLVLTPKDVVIVLIEALHRDPLIYPEPERFWPERFLERRYAPFEYLPFGGGVRRCLGAAFSDYETKIFLATLLRRTELACVRPGPEPRVRRNITMGPKFGVPLKVVSVSG
ncbi:MAG: cytochrome P450 [Myxococcales bacterium]